MLRKLVLVSLLGVALSGCTENVTTSSYAVDVDEDGIVGCGDLDRVHMCLHALDPLPGEADPCTKADVSRDGMIDDEDIHGLHQGLRAAGQECGEPIRHDMCGVNCDVEDWVLMQYGENEWEHENEHEAGCEGDCQGEQTRFRLRCRCRCRLQGCEGEDCPDCSECRENCGCGPEDDPGDDPEDDPGDDPEDDPDDDPDDDGPIIN